jgi:hypothetical protein
LQACSCTTAFYGSKRDIQNTGRFEIIHFINIYQYDYAAIASGELIQYFDKVTFKLRTELSGKWRGGQSGRCRTEAE